MKVVLTGSSGRIGRAIFGALASDNTVTGIDRNVFSTTHIIGDCTDAELLKRALDGADAVIHAAGPHAPHVGVVSDAEFERVNVEGTRTLFEIAKASGVKRFVYTSTTAMYGHAIIPGECTWVDESTEPAPKSIYHRTKLAAEQWLAQAASDALRVRIIRMSRCFPEPATEMALYRLHRGVDARDVGTAHALALDDDCGAFARFVVSGRSPFTREDCEGLAKAAPDILRQRAPALVESFARRGWTLPHSIDRVYCAEAAQTQLGWKPRWGWDEVIAQWDRQSIEVLPPAAIFDERSE